MALMLAAPLVAVGMFADASDGVTATRREPVTTSRQVSRRLAERSVQQSDFMPGVTFGPATAADTRVRSSGGIFVCGSFVGRGKRLGRLAYAVHTPGDTSSSEEGQVSLEVEAASYRTARDAAAVLPAFQAAVSNCGSLSAQTAPLGAARQGEWLWSFSSSSIASWVAPPGVEVAASSADVGTIIGGTIEAVRPFHVSLDFVVLRYDRYVISLQIASQAVASLVAGGEQNLVTLLAQHLLGAHPSVTP